MNNNQNDINGQKQPVQANNLSKVTVVPVFKKPVDLNKLGHALILLAAQAVERESTDLIDNIEKPESSSLEGPDTGGGHEKIL